MRRQAGASVALVRTSVERGQFESESSLAKLALQGKDMMASKRKARFKVGQTVWCNICKKKVQVLSVLKNGDYTTTCEPKVTGSFGVKEYELAAREKGGRR